MSEAKHTPGPWSIFEEAALDYRPCYVKGANGASWIACCMGGGPKRAVDKAEERANARLLAAAPELLAFAQYVADTDPGNPAPFFAKARAVIAKATNTGGSP